MKPFPRSHPRSLTTATAGERGGAEGMASIPLVDLSARLLHRIGCNLRLIGAPARENRPGDAGELVGERDRQRVAVEPLRCLLDPGPQTPHGGARASHQQHLRGLHE